MNRTRQWRIEEFLNGGGGRGRDPKTIAFFNIAGISLVAKCNACFYPQTFPMDQPLQEEDVPYSN